MYFGPGFRFVVRNWRAFRTSLVVIPKLDNACSRFTLVLFSSPVLVEVVGRLLALNTEEK